MTIVIELEIDGDASEAYDVVDRLLDAGTIQDLIHEYAEDMDRGPLLVTGAIAVLRSNDAIPVRRIPPCAAAMGCLCAGHARGNDPDAACDTTE
jgi:hypothetical protein